MSAAGVVIVGAGQGGFQLATSLREGGFSGKVTLIGEESALPYQRPPLSKAFIKTSDDPEALIFRPAGFYEKHGIAVRLGMRAASVDRAAQQVHAEDGSAIDYDTLVLATGARNRKLTVSGIDRTGVFTLRDAADGLALRAALHAAQGGRVIVVGGGFQGLEMAASACALGLSVHVIEAGDRLMGRTVSPAIADYMLAHHRTNGIAVRLGESVTAITGGDAATGVRTASGESLPADLVVIAIGVVPNVELAEAAGLAAEGGIVVDAGLRTSDPSIYALGDCARYPSVHGGGMLRLESVQNAVDQARCVAAGILGTPKPYDALPWFWSDQGARLQVAGLTAGADDAVVRGEAHAFSVYCFRQERLIGVESINRPADHVKARRQLAGAAVHRAEFH